MNSRLDPDCLTCQAQLGTVRLTNAPRILETLHWRVEHAHPTSIRGRFVVAATRHVPALHQLSQEEFASLTELLRLLCKAISEILGAEKEYIMQFAEAEGHNHVHFHVIARMPDWPLSLKGSSVFNGLGPAVERPLPTEELTPLAISFRNYLQERL